MREQHAATIGFLLTGRKTGWRLQLKRRVAVDYFFHIRGAGMHPIEHVPGSRHIIRKCQTAAVGQLASMEARLNPDGRCRFSSGGVAMLTHLRISQFLRRSLNPGNVLISDRFFGLTGLSTAGLLVVLFVWEDFTGSKGAWAGAMAGSVATGFAVSVVAAGIAATGFGAAGFGAGAATWGGAGFTTTGTGSGPRR